MKNQLYIKCINSFDHCDILLLGPKGEVISQFENESINNASQKINLNESNITLLIGTPDIVIKSVALPKKMSSSHINKIVPNLLEEDLISNVETIHFTYDKQHDSQITVAMLSHDKMQNWLEALKNAGVNPQAIYPLCLSLKANKEQWHVWIESDSSIVKIDSNRAFFIETNLLPALLDQLYQNESIKPNIIMVSSNNIDSAKSILSDQNHEFYQKINFRKSPIWEAFDIENNHLNLLHHEFANQDNQSKKQQLYFHGALFILFALLTVFGLALKDIYIYSKIKKDQSNKIEAIYKSIYPQATSVVSPKARIERDLAAQSTASGSVFYDSLFQVGKLLNENKAITLESIAFNHQGLTITIEA
ncbi:MAG: type II secretion system protein GspL, partial [Candidatus Berkiella sp.]